MQKEKKSSSIRLLLQWAGKEKYWMYLAVILSFFSGICTMIPYYGIYSLMSAVYTGTCTTEFVIRDAGIIAGGIVIRFLLFGASGVASHKGAYRALLKVRCMVIDHMAKVPLGALNERSTGEIKTVLNEDIEKLELFLAHNVPELICYLIGPVVVFIYLLTVNVPLALVSLVPLVLALFVMCGMFMGASSMMGRANQSVANLNSVMVEYISGMKLIKAYNMGSKSFQKFSAAVKEENDVWNEMSKRMGPFYASFIVVIECGMLLLVPLGGMLFLNGSITASVFLLFAFVGSMYLTEIRPLQEISSNMAQVLKAVTKTEEILELPIYEGGGDFPQAHDIELRNVRFSYDGKVNVLEHCNLKVKNGERMALVGRSGAGKSTIAKAVSKKLGFIYVDTGALYRSIGLYVLNKGKDTANQMDVAALLPEINVQIRYVDGVQHVYLNEKDVSDDIRRPPVSMAASNVSAHPEVREFLLNLQRQFAKENNVVMDGRDIGTVVLPNADIKIFLTASSEERARRRYKELTEKGEKVEFEQIHEEIKQRDYNDSHRAIAPLKQADDAILVDTTECTLEESIDKLETVIRSRMK